MSGQQPKTTDTDWSRSPAAMVSCAILGIAGIIGLVWSLNLQPTPAHAPAGIATMNMASDSPARLLIDLNNAQARELEMLPSIGPTIAQRIVDHRTKHGPFDSLNDLDDVHGIGPKTIAKVSDWVTLSEP